MLLLGSTIFELRPGSRDHALNPAADPKGDLEEASNFDNFRIAPGATHKDWRVEPKLYR